MTRRNRPEEALQRAVARYLDLALPKDAVWHHSPNGGARSKAEAGIFKAMGTRAGWPDIEIVWRGRVFFIELKTDKAVLSDNQKGRHVELINAGSWVEICRSVDAVEQILLFWRIPLNATTGTRAA